MIARLREKELVRTNGLGAERQFAVGRTYVVDGVTYRITRHKTFHTAPWSTIVVFGVRV